MPYDKNLRPDAEKLIGNRGKGGAFMDQASANAFRVNTLEIVHPGYAYTWTDDATGIKIRTNLSSKDCNRRDPEEGIVYFKSDKALWAWAIRVRESTERSATAAASRDYE